MPTDNTTLTRREIKKIFKRHHGAQGVAAKEIGVARVTVSLWLKGKVQSKRLDGAIPEFAARLAASEAA